MIWPRAREILGKSEKFVYIGTPRAAQRHRRKQRRRHVVASGEGHMVARRIWGFRSGETEEPSVLEVGYSAKGDYHKTKAIVINDPGRGPTVKNGPGDVVAPRISGATRIRMSDRWETKPTMNEKNLLFYSWELELCFLNLHWLV